MKTAADKSVLLRIRPNVPAFFLALAFFCGGLRLPGAWLIFGIIFLPWAALSREPFAPGERPAALLFFIWLFISALFAPEPAQSWAVFGAYLIPGLVFFYAAASGEGEQNWLGAVMALGAVAGLSLITQKILGRPVVGLIGMNPNYTAVFAAAAFPAALLAAGSENGHKKILAAGLALLLAAGLLASGSRGAVLAAFLAAAGALALDGRKKTLALLCIASLGAFVLLPDSFWGGLLKLNDARALERPRIWGAALETAINNPYFGAGPGMFEKAFELVKFPYFDGISFYGHSTGHAHSEPLNIAAEAGLPAALFFLAAFGGALWSGVKRSLPLAACALAVFIQGSVDVVFHCGAVALLFWGTLGFIVPRTRSDTSVSCRVRAALCVLCFAGLLAGATAGFRGSGKPARFQPAAQAAALRATAFNMALRSQAVLDRPKDPFAAAAAGAAAAAAGQLEQAEINYKAALALEPFYFGARLELAKVYAAQGRRAEGCAQLKLLDGPLYVHPVNDYQHRLMAGDRTASDLGKKDLCLKMRPGVTTAPTPKTR